MDKEQAFFFQRPDGSRLFGIYHPALTVAPGDASPPAILYCNPIFEEHLCSHRISVNFARYAAKCGFSVLRFDYFGDGESDGLFEDASVSSRASDILTAVSHLRENFQPSRICLVGLRFGAALALLAAEKDKAIDGVVCWSPLVNLQDYLYTLLRSNLTTQMALYKKVLRDRDALVEQIMGGDTVNVDGYEVGRPLYHESIGVDLSKQRVDTESRVLVVQISPSPRPERPVNEFVAVNQGLKIESVSIKEEKFWLPLARVYPPCEELFAQTVEWMGYP